MSYSSRYGKRGFEPASKVNHSQIIHDKVVKDFLSKCSYPKDGDEVAIERGLLHNVNYPDHNPIKHIITVDGGNTTVAVRKNFPSSNITFFQFGAHLLNMKDLEDMETKPFISREEMQAIKNLNRNKLVLPTKTIIRDGYKSLTENVLHAVYDYFLNHGGEENQPLIDALAWLVFRQYENKAEASTGHELASCPHRCGNKKIPLEKASMQADFTFRCEQCEGVIYLTDIFRFHEVIDDELGASGILGYLTNVVETLMIVHYIKSIYNLKKSWLKEILFIKDGPLGFFGQTANLHSPMREMCIALQKEITLNLVGIEKSGSFVEHADEISGKLDPGQVLLLNNRHIYKYIIPGDPDTTEPYASTSYYSGKFIFKTREERLMVVTLPTETNQVYMSPIPEDYFNLNNVLLNLELLKCDLYDNSILPVALANKLISLSDHPSSQILTKFAQSSML